MMQSSYNETVIEASLGQPFKSFVHDHGPVVMVIILAEVLLMKSASLTTVSVLGAVILLNRQHNEMR